MSNQVLNDQTFSPARTRELAPEGARPMTYGAVIETGVRGAAPHEWAWYCAYGLLSSLVWLYLEILRLLALLRRGG